MNDDVRFVIEYHVPQVTEILARDFGEAERLFKAYMPNAVIDRTHLKEPRRAVSRVQSPS